MITILGLSDAGKSTWLGSLLDCLEDLPGDLQLRKPQASFATLDSYRQTLLGGAYPQHTGIEDQHSTRFQLHWRGEPVDVDISDYSGERISRLHRRASHEWDAGWQERAQSTRVAVLLRADRIVRLARRAAPKPEQRFFSPDLSPDEPTEPDRHPPTALALLEALQAMWAWRSRQLGRPAALHAERVAIVLTAWDTQPHGDPRRFLDDNAPLLASWLATNVHPADLSVFGLSATGGDLNVAEHRSRVIQEGLAEVAYCCADGRSEPAKGSGLPLQWLLDTP